MFLPVIIKGFFAGTIAANEGADTFATYIVGQHDVGDAVSVQFDGFFVVFGVADKDGLWINAVQMFDQQRVGAKISNRAND